MALFSRTAKAMLAGSALIALAACNSTTSTSGSTAASAMAGSGGVLGNNAFNIPEFPTGVATSDGFQANPANDATFATLINSVRTTAGAPALAYNAQLDAAAQAHSNDMLANDFTSHTGSNGSDVKARVIAQGYTPTLVGENVAQGQQNENEVLLAWQNSSGHRANNENVGFKDFGLARAGTGAATRWTLVLGAK